MEHEMDLRELEGITGGVYTTVQKTVLEETGDYQVLMVSDPFRTEYHGVCKLCGNVEKGTALRNVRARLGQHLFERHR